MSRDHILGFPNKMPKVDWSKNLPVFRNQEGNDAALHLVKFHIHVHRLKINFPEDCLMKMFMATLEGKARSWYEGLKPCSLFSLKEFHTTFFEFYGKYNHSFLLFEDFCESYENFIQYLEETFGDEECLDYEIIEALYEYYSQQKITEISCFDTKDHSQRISTPSLLEDETKLHPNSQEEIGPSENSEIACTKNLSSEPSNDNDHLLL